MGSKYTFFGSFWDSYGQLANSVLLTDLNPDINPESDRDFLDPSPGPASAQTPGPVDCSLLGVAEMPSEVGVISIKSPTESDDYDVSISNLPEKLGFTPEFLAEVEKVGGNSLQLCHKLLASHSSEGSHFRAGQLCSTAEQFIFIHTPWTLVQWFHVG